MRLLCILRESEAGVCRTLCVRSGTDVVSVPRAGGGKYQKKQQG